MPEHRISPTVRALIAARVHSIEQLEALLLLHAEPARTWTCREAADRLQIDVSSAEGALSHLHAQELAVRAPGAPPTFRYAPAAAELADQVAELAQAYHQARLEMLVLISTNAIDRVRTAGLRTFAQAFLLKERKKDG